MQEEEEEQEEKKTKKKKVLLAGDSRGFISYYRHKFFITHTHVSMSLFKSCGVYKEA
jgi:hypothetical protein